jgi:hypothetical protein
MEDSMSEVINNQGCHDSLRVRDELYDYNVRINPQDNWDIEVFTTATDDNGFRDRFEFTFRNPPTHEELLGAITNSKLEAVA